MPSFHPRVAAVVVALAVTTISGAASPAAGTGASAEPADVVHVLERLTYGPRPGDIEAVAKVGIDRWIEQQLHPEQIRDEGMASRLAPLRTIQLSSADVMKGYELPREAKRKIQEATGQSGGGSEQARARLKRDLRAQYRDTMLGPPKQVVDELQQAKILRAVHSERQLEEVLVDFWMNHFNVYAQKGNVRYLVGEYEREVIRPQAFGKFEDLVKATAESPAMLFYLDNWLSSAPNAVLDRRPDRPMSRWGRRGMMRPRSERAMPQQRPGRRRGLNENYARELMELHTLGVDGGYTQKDVTEVARCFTGWTIRGFPEQDPRFVFDSRLHHDGDKVVLGQPIKSSGKNEGDEILHRLATHASTAKFISFKLARRFVSDQPPPAVVDRAAETFRRTGSNIREVVRAIITAPEFMAPENRSAKIKTPLEFATSAVRGLGANVTDASVLSRRIAAMGMPLYLQQPPTGYKDTADAWVSASGLVARLNLALDLAAGRVPGITVAGADHGAEGHDIVEAVARRLVPEGLGESTRKTVATNGGDDAARIAGLILGSPEFQRR